MDAILRVIEALSTARYELGPKIQPYSVYSVVNGTSFRFLFVLCDLAIPPSNAQPSTVPRSASNIQLSSSKLATFRRRLDCTACNSSGTVVVQGQRASFYSSVAASAGPPHDLPGGSPACKLLFLSISSSLVSIFSFSIPSSSSSAACSSSIGGSVGTVTW